MDRFASPKLPKGRGVWLSDIVDSGAVGHSKSIPDGCADKGLVRAQVILLLERVPTLPLLAVMLIPFTISQT